MAVETKMALGHVVDLNAEQGEAAVASSKVEPADQQAGAKVVVWVVAWAQRLCLYQAHLALVPK